MAKSKAVEASREGDRAASVDIKSVETLGLGFRRYERVDFTLRGPDGSVMALDREVLRAGLVVGVLPVDLARGEVVLIRQFRLAAHLATGLGSLVELVAGRVDAGETPAAAACRECREEIGLDPLELAPIRTFMPAVALADEVMSLWLARVDARKLPDIAGHLEEGEVIQPLRFGFDAALALLEGDAIVNAPLVIALQWLAANRHRLSEVLRTRA